MFHFRQTKIRPVTASSATAIVYANLSDEIAARHRHKDEVPEGFGNLGRYHQMRKGAAISLAGYGLSGKMTLLPGLVREIFVGAIPESGSMDGETAHSWKPDWHQRLNDIRQDWDLKDCK